MVRTNVVSSFIPAGGGAQLRVIGYLNIITFSRPQTRAELFGVNAYAVGGGGAQSANRPFAKRKSTSRTHARC